MLRGTPILEKGPQKFFTPRRIVNMQQRFTRRNEPHMPYVAERQIVKKQKLLDKFEEACANGDSFVPDGRLPPWKKRVNPELDRGSGTKANFLGFRVRLAQPTQNSPGFPTHFQE